MNTNDIVDELINDQYTDHCLSDYMTDEQKALAFDEFVAWYSSLKAGVTIAEITEYLSEVIEPFVARKVEVPDIAFSKGNESDHKREQEKAA